MNRQIIIIILLLFPFFLSAQEEEKNSGQLHGNFETIVQTYRVDTIIGIDSADVPREKALSNSYMNLTYTKGKFSAGIRYEVYMNTLEGFDKRYDGHGIANRYASYTSDELEITAGNFYEQFGNGLILRTYEEKTLGIDNSLDGIKLKYKPVKGIKLTGIIGKQRLYWTLGPGIVRGLDGEISFNETFKKLAKSKTHFLLGGSFVSKYQKNLNPKYNYPENVGAFAGRINLSRGGFIISSEYAYKINDPSADNSIIYGYPIFKDGNALFVNASWSKKGIGFLFTALRLDNMSFRSDRSASVNDLSINYLPAITKTHTYAFPAMYPFATQTNGQVGFNADFFYTFKRKTLLGGKYGTNININFSQVNSIKTEKITINPDAEIKNLDGYTSDFFAVGDELYFRDINIELHKKINKKFKISLIYMYQDYNKLIMQGKDSILHADIGVFDLTYKISSKQSIRFATQALLTDKTQSGEKNDFGDWYTGMVEYTYSPHWFVAISDQYNTGGHTNPVSAHYYNFAAGFVKGANRIQIGYGRQREGIVCAGGVCRFVPAASGFNFTLTGSF
ncbi:MAG: DUF6029 family protein [Bacteroidales bacterium]|nr:DUF6029 family protein [Bacteroidales bacterium]